MVKYQKLWAFADELGLTIRFHGRSTTLEDTDFDQPFDLEDIEPNQVIDCFPYPMEVKITFENPRYVALERQREEAQKAKMKALEQDEKKRLQEKEDLAKKKTAEELKKKELQELERLKAKYMPFDSA
jgi:hypothetical protein